MASKPLQVYTKSSSEKGLSSVTSLIVGSKACVLIDPPFLVPDANAVVEWIKSKTSNTLSAVFVTHHHPDHYMSANPILEAFPNSKLYAAPYVCDGINREYDDKVEFWPKLFGRENIPVKPTKPTPYPFSFFKLEGDSTSPVVLLGPLQGDSVDHTLFWLPREKTIICGDAIYARSTHVWVEEVETPALLHAWQHTLDLITSLSSEKIIPGHIEAGWEIDGQADLAHTRKYLDFFARKVTYAKTKPQVKELFEAFKKEFPKANKNLEFFLGNLSNRFGEGGKVWEENRHHDVGSRTEGGLLGFVMK